MDEHVSIDVIAGARPNFMKVAPILRALGRTSLRASLVHTGQHYDAEMSSVFFQQLGIPPPDAHLGVGSGSHGQQTAAVLERYEQRLLECKPRPRGVIVVGDVNSTVACSLAAVKLGVSVAHVEAGLRSFDRSMPEEINRIVTDSIADLLFVSEPSGEANLRAEGIPAARIHAVGNVMIDTLVRERTAASALGMPATLGLGSGGYVYVTLHRPSNVDDAGRLADLVGLLVCSSTRLTVVFPVHPRTRAALERFGLLSSLQDCARVRLLPPLGYRESLGLMDQAAVVLTDSGGVQEETTFLGIPCLTLRPNTERPITVTRGTNTLVDGDLARVERLIDDVIEGKYRNPAPIEGWDGHAAERIAAIVVRYWDTVPSHS